MLGVGRGGKDRVRDVGRERRGGCWGGRLAERAGRWILQDGLDRQRYRRGKGVVVKTGDAPQASDGISWRDAADELICLMVIRWERRRKQLKAVGGHRHLEIVREEFRKIKKTVGT